MNVFMKEEKLTSVNTLHMTLNREWFDLIVSGVKLEEYREIKSYWFRNLIAEHQKSFKDCTGYDWSNPLFREEGVLYCCSTNKRKLLTFKSFDQIAFRNGYGKDVPSMTVECTGIEIGTAKPEWSGNWQGEVFIIRLGKVLSKNNC